MIVYLSGVGWIKEFMFTKAAAHDIILNKAICGVIIMREYAILSNKGQYTIFRYGQDTFRFRAPYSLEYYSEIREWNHGYIAVMTKYCHDEELIEEYIDLVPILKNLYVDADAYLKQIKEVRIQYD